MDRFVNTAQRSALMLLVCVVVFSAARSSACGAHSSVPIVIALGLASYLIWRAWRSARRLFPKPTVRPIRLPALPTRSQWLSPRTLQRRGRP